MRNWLFLFILPLLLCSNMAAGAIFVVTSNADSGPGTLREALTLAAANGSSQKDFINFNLPGTSESARTIAIATSLPMITSNVVIDGTTQNGVVFGQSDARVKVSTLYQSYDDNKIIVFEAQNAAHVEIYGLYIYDFTDIVLSRPALAVRNGLKFTNCTNIIIGAVNKGNLIRGFSYYSLDFEKADHITLQANVIGVTQFNKVGNEGEDAGSYDAASGLINFANCDHITLGGDISQGNLIFTGINLQFTELSNVTVNIKSNNFLVYKDGVSTVNSLAEFYRPLIMVSTILTGEIQNDEQARTVEANVNMDVSNNVSGSSLELFRFNLIAGTTNFTNNFFDVARDGSTIVGSSQGIASLEIPIEVSDCKAQFNIGTNDKTKRNLFYNVQQGVRVSGDPNVFLRYNDFKCVLEYAYKNQIFATKYTLPDVVINSVSKNGLNTHVDGTATPNATIDIYSSESCQVQCSIRSYTQTVTADNSGKWQTDILNLSGIFYASATLNNQTSEFKTFQVNADNIKIKPLRCDDVGYIAGLKVPSGISYYWVDEGGKKVSDDLDLKITKPGKYQLVLGEGCITSDWFEITDDRLQIFDNGIKTTDISCGIANGSIKGLFIYDPENKIKATTWADQTGKVVGNTVDVDHLPAGIYSLTVLTTDDCTKNYGVVNIKNTAGVSFNYSQMQIEPNGCSISVGAIKNIIIAGGQGDLKYSWKNEQGVEVATTKDLTGQLKGSYTLQVTDGSGCPPISSKPVDIDQSSGISYDDSHKKVVNATCGEANGAITDVKAISLIHKESPIHYKWTDKAGNTVGDKQDLINIGGGDYQFWVWDDCGAILNSSFIHVDGQPATIYPDYSYKVTDICPGSDYGSITVQTDALAKSARWVNSQGQNMPSNSTTISNLPAGVYKLYLTNQNGCEIFYKSYTVSFIAPLQIIQGTEQKQNDQCGSKTGSIKNIWVLGGALPYTFTWYNADGKTISTSPDLLNVGEGTYTVQVIDVSSCNLPARQNFTINNDAVTVAAPVVNPLQLCSPGEALLLVNNASPTTVYRLYNTATAISPIAEKAGGGFTINAVAGSTFYVSQLNGLCESARAPVQISVSLSAIDIANTFTPNGDGHNDYWKINNIESYPAAVVQVFNRNGQKLFESKGYATPFNGTYIGKALPVGTYYYIINLNKNCNLLSGSLTILR